MRHPHLLTYLCLALLLAMPLTAQRGVGGFTKSGGGGGGGGGGGSGDVVGPASAGDEAICRFDTTTGKLIQSSGVTLDDSGNLNLGTGNLFGNGTVGAAASERSTVWTNALDDNDGTIDVGAVLAMGVNAITTSSTVDGRDVSADGTTLDAVATTYLPLAGGTLTGNTTLSSVDLLCAVDAACDVGASGTEIGTVYAQKIEDGDGQVRTTSQFYVDHNVAGGNDNQAALYLDLVTAQGEEAFVVDMDGTVAFRINRIATGPQVQISSGTTFKMQETDVECSLDSTCDVGASGVEMATAWVEKIDDSDGEVSVAAALEVVGDITLNDAAGTVVRTYASDTDGWFNIGTTGILAGAVYTYAISGGTQASEIISEDTIRPIADSSHDLGTTTRYWATTYTDDIQTGFIQFASTAATCSTTADEGTTYYVADSNSSSYCLCMRSGASSVTATQLHTAGATPPSC